jgi:hypothetical protein
MKKHLRRRRPRIKPPWRPSELNNERKNLQGFENFLLWADLLLNLKVTSLPFFI